MPWLAHVLAVIVVSAGVPTQNTSCRRSPVGRLMLQQPKMPPCAPARKQEVAVALRIEPNSRAVPGAAPSMRAAAVAVRFLAGLHPESQWADWLALG